jgi:hypothetical protein
MASYTDQIMQSNPYVQQLPLEAMAQVGMYKQQKYEEGIQKIQGQIDRVAGLDVARDVDKQYLQSKLNELGSKLKTVAAGDFSNFQLVNSVGGMATQIGRDGNVQNAVGSTARYRKEIGEMEAARKAGKSSAENEFWFGEQANQWMNSKDLKSQYNGRFVEYRDVRKKLIDLSEKIKEVENITENPFKRDASGNVLVGKDGKPLVDDAILAVTTKGKSADKLLKMFNDGLDENDKQQMLISSHYEYRSATKDTFKKDIQDTYDANKKILSDESANLAVELKTNDKLSAADKAKYEARLNDVNNVLKNNDLEKKLNADLSEIDKVANIDDFKYRLYKDKLVTGLAKDMSYQSYKYEYKNNPYAQMDMERKNLQFKYDDAARQQANFNATKAFEMMKFRYSMSQDALKAAGGQPVVTDASLPTNVNTPTLIGVQQDLNGKMEARKQLDATYGNTLFGSLSTVPPKKGEKSPRQKALDDIVSKYNTNPNSITDPDRIEYIKTRRSFDLQIAQKQNLYNGVVKSSEKFDAQFAATLANEEGVNFSNGKTLYTSKELFEVGKDVEKFYKTSGGAGGPMYASGKTTFDAQGLVNKYKNTKYAAVAQAYAKNYLGQPLTNTEKVILDKGRDITQKYSSVLLKTYQDKEKFQSEELSRLMPERQIKVGTLDLDNNKIDKAHVEQLIGNKFRDYASHGRGAVDTKNRGDFNPDTINEWRTGKGSGGLIYTIEKNYDGSANLIIQKGAATQTVPMNSTEFNAFFPKYAVSHSLDEVKMATLSSPNNTTNVVGTRGDASGAVNAYFSGYDIPGLRDDVNVAPSVRLDIEGNPRNDGGANDTYSVRMYAYDGQIWKTSILNQKGYATIDGVEAILQNIGTHTVNNVLKSNQ